MGVDGPATPARSGDVLFRDGEIPTQMPFVLNRLVEPYGNFSPTGALWAQVGISQPYQMLLGAAEVLGGQLLLLPRTAAVGALVCAFDLTQVFILNMTHDIRLKSVSSQLLLLSLFLLAPYARRLFVVLFTNPRYPGHLIRAAVHRPSRQPRVVDRAGVCRPSPTGRVRRAGMATVRPTGAQPLRHLSGGRVLRRRLSTRSIAHRRTDP
jgi:hypothetical protein